MDAEHNTEDAVQDGQPSGEKAKPSEKTYTQAEVDQLIRQNHSKLDKQVNELKRANQDAATARDEAQRAVEEMQELNLRDDPDGLKAWRLKKDSEKRLKEAEQKAVEAQRKLDEANEKATEYEAWKKQQASVANASKIAAKYEGVTAQELIDLTDGSPEKMELAAKRIGKAKVPDFIPDAGIGAGSGEPIFTETQIADYEFYKANKDAILKAQKEGRIKRS